MPSFADNISPDQAWDLVFYLRTFQPMHSKEKEIAKQTWLETDQSERARSSAGKQVSTARRERPF